MMLMEDGYFKVGNFSKMKFEDGCGTYEVLREEIQEASKRLQDWIAKTETKELLKTLVMMNATAFQTLHDAIHDVESLVNKTLSAQKDAKEVSECNEKYGYPIEE